MWWLKSKVKWTQKDTYNSYSSWSHWSDQINRPKTGGVEQIASCRAMLKWYAVVRIEVASCSNLTVELFFKLMALYLLTQPILQFNCCSLTWFETLLNNYKLGAVQEWHYQLFGCSDPLASHNLQSSNVSMKWKSR